MTIAQNNFSESGYVVEVVDKENSSDLCSIYVGNVPWKATPEEIAELIGTKTNVRVKEVRIVKEKGTGRSRGFAFVDIYHSKPEEFIRSAPELVLAGRTLTIKYANARKAQEAQVNPVSIQKNYTPELS